MKLPCECNTPKAKYFRSMKYRHLQKDPICKECLKLGIERKAIEVIHEPHPDSELDMCDCFRFVSVCQYHYQKHVSQMKKCLQILTIDDL
jgi:hypothetical protein